VPRIKKPTLPAIAWSILQGASGSLVCSNTPADIPQRTSREVCRPIDSAERDLYRMEGHPAAQCPPWRDPAWG
jgi:hypothetical protein